MQFGNEKSKQKVAQTAIIYLLFLSLSLSLFLWRSSIKFSGIRKSSNVCCFSSFLFCVDFKGFFKQIDFIEINSKATVYFTVVLVVFIKKFLVVKLPLILNIFNALFTHCLLIFIFFVQSLKLLQLL